MFKLLNKKKNNKGFTLVELVIVVAILAILVGILAPQYTKYVEKSRKAADASNLENLVTAFKTAASDSSDQILAGSYTISIDATGSKVKKGETDVSTGNGTVGSVIASYAGSTWTDTKLKSKKWTSDGTDNGTLATEIKADITVKNDGSVDVEYTPETLKDQTDK